MCICASIGKISESFNAEIKLFYTIITQFSQISALPIVAHFSLISVLCHSEGIGKSTALASFKVDKRL